MTHADYRSLPDGLPAPVDDGAADHLPGLELPDWLRRPGLLVAFVYPRTGTPGEPLPPGWDDIPGARGCTPQSCAFRDHHGALASLGATVVGISAMDAGEQAAFAEREQLPYELINDSSLRLRDCAAPADLRDGRHDPLQAADPGGPRRPDREGLLPGLPAGPQCGRRGGVAARGYLNFGMPFGPASFSA